MESSSWLDRARNLINEFEQATSTTAQDRSALIYFLESRPRRDTNDLILIDNVQTRVDLARQFLQLTKDGSELGCWNTASWSVFMVAPTECLILHGGWSDVLRFRALTPLLMVLLKTFLTRPIGNTTRGSAGIEAELKDESVRRSQTEAEKCLLRDASRCIVTGARYPDACHIFPFSALKQPDTTSRSLHATLFTLWGRHRADGLRHLLVGDQNIVDTAQNMISLSPSLHRLWGKAIFGLEPVAQLENGVRLRFRWMKHIRLELGQRMPESAHPDEVLSFPDGSGSLNVRHLVTGRPIVDGEIIDITSDDESSSPNYEILQLQWDLIKMASLSGAAEAMEDESWDPKWDDFSSSFPAAVAQNAVVGSHTAQESPPTHTDLPEPKSRNPSL